MHPTDTSLALYPHIGAWMRWLTVSRTANETVSNADFVDSLGDSACTPRSEMLDRLFQGVGFLFLVGVGVNEGMIGGVYCYVVSRRGKGGGGFTT